MRWPVARQSFLPFAPPTLGEEEIAEVVDTLRSGWITTGPKVKRFEQKFAEAVGAPRNEALSLSSCSAGLHLAMIAHGIGPGDEVIIPSLTFAATANVVEHEGAKPVLVDVDPVTLCIDPDAVEAAITERTRVIMPVHYAGHPADMDRLFELADGLGIAIVEDAAHAVATEYKGVRVGSRENLAAFSFYATKNITTAEGGALTGAEHLLARAREMSSHGMNADGWRRFDKTGSWQYDITAPGFKYNMTDIQAALGLHQLDRLAGFQATRRHVVERYQEAFGRSEAFELPVEAPYATSSWHLYVLRLRPEVIGMGRDAFIRALTAANIGTSVHYVPLHGMSYYAKKYGFEPASFPVAWDAYERMVSLPLHAGMTDQDTDDVIEAVFSLVGAHAI